MINLLKKPGLTGINYFFIQELVKLFLCCLAAIEFWPLPALRIEDEILNYGLTTTSKKTLIKQYKIKPISWFCILFNSYSNPILFNCLEDVFLLHMNKMKSN